MFGAWVKGTLQAGFLGAGPIRASYGIFGQCEKV